MIRVLCELVCSGCERSAQISLDMSDLIWRDHKISMHGSEFCVEHTPWSIDALQLPEGWKDDFGYVEYSKRMRVLDRFPTFGANESFFCPDCSETIGSIIDGKKKAPR